MKKYLFIITFITILLIGTFFRFYKLGDVPNSLNWDEVSWGYNAYSIGETGRDEHGNRFPLSFKAFGDYKQPMYVYLDVLPIKIFGLNAFAVRFPSALLGTLTIISVYFLTRELFRGKPYAKVTAMLTMAFFAVSPWSIQFSRVAFEANVALFYIATGLCLFMRGVNTKEFKFQIVGVIVLSLSGYTYHSAKVFTPLLLIGFLFVAKYYYHQSLKRLLVLFGIFLLVSMVWIVDGRTTARGRSVMFTSNQTQILKNSTDKIIYDQENNDMIGEILHNRRFVYANTYLENYLSHFNPNFLFITGDHPRHHAPSMGVIYMVFLPFILIGMYFLIIRKIYAGWILFYWMILAPAASALAVDAPNASRSLVFLPIWEIFAATGIVGLSTYINSRIIKRTLLGICSFAFILNVLYFAHNYFANTNLEFSSYWQYGYKESVQFVNKYRNSEKKVYFAQDIEQAYIFYLYHNKITPDAYIKSGGSARKSQKCYLIENAYFGECNDKVKEGDVIISTKSVIGTKKTKKVKVINSLNKDTSIAIYEK